MNTRTRATRTPRWPGWSAADVPKLKVKWAFGFPGELSVDSQPTVAGGRVFVGTQSGTVYALSAATGCVHWMFQAAAAVRAAVTIAPIHTRAAHASGRVHRRSIRHRLRRGCGTGTLIWKAQVDDFRSRASPARRPLHNGRLYVGVASGEETAGAVADYECCKFRGSLVALDAATGTQVWKTFTIEQPKPTSKNKVGTQLWGPSGAPIW